MVFPGDWSYYKKITIPAAQVTGGPHSNYIAFVRLGDDADIQSKTYYPDGRDIRFSEDQSTILNYELVHDGQFATANGCWTWFNGPIAFRYNGVTYLGWIDSDGYRNIASFDGVNYNRNTLSSYTSEVDDHDNPAIAICSDGKILLAYSNHNSDNLIRFIKSSNAEDISSFGSETTVDIGDTCTYANLERLSSEGSGSGRIYCFVRKASNIWAYLYSDDDGATWSAVNEFWSTGAQCYCQFYGNGTDRIDIIATPGHPANNTNREVYHFYFTGGKFYNTDGTEITATLPFDETALNSSSQIFSSSTDSAWIWDITHDGTDPYVLYVVYPGDDFTNHDYYYAYLSGGSWTSVKLADAGSYLYSGEEAYSGGLCFADGDPTVIYLAIEKSSIYEIEKWESNDHYSTITKTEITSGSTFDNFRPFTVRNGNSSDKIRCMWCGSQDYPGFGSYRTAIRLYPGIKSRFEYAWVQLTSDIGDTDVDLYVYYGNSAATDASSPASVWSAYKAIIHAVPNLNNCWQFKDSTGNGFDADFYSTIINEQTLDLSNLFDYSKDLPSTYLLNPNDSPDEWIEIDKEDDTNLSLGGATQFSIETIFQWEQPRTDNEYCLVSNWDGSSGEALFRIETDGSLEAYITRGGSTEGGATGSFSLSTGTWYLGSFVFDADATSDEDLSVQIDKTRASRTVVNNSSLDTVANTYYFGRRNSKSEAFQGYVSEIRIGEIFRSEGFQSTQYDNIFNYSTFLTIGSEQNVTGGTTVTQTTNLDALINKTVQQTTSMDALVSKQETVNLSVDAILQAVKSVASDLDALLRKEVQTSTDLDALIKKSGITSSTSLDAVIKEVLTQSLSMDALIQGTDTSNLSIDALLQKIGVTASTSIDALIRKEGLTSATSLDAIIVEAGATSIVTSIDALIRKEGITFTCDIDALISKSYSSQLSIDALINKSKTNTIDLDAILSKTKEESTLLDALLLSSGITSTTNLDALIQNIGQTISTVMDAILIRSMAYTTQLDALISGTLTQAIYLDAIIGEDAFPDPIKTFIAKSKLFNFSAS